MVKHLKDKGAADLRSQPYPSVPVCSPERVRKGRRVRRPRGGAAKGRRRRELHGLGRWVVRSDTVGGACDWSEPLFFIDIAVPRDIDPVVQTLERIYLYDIDDLQAVVGCNAEGRQDAAEEGEAMISPPSWSSRAGSRRCTSSRSFRNSAMGPSRYGVTSSPAPSPRWNSRPKRPLRRAHELRPRQQAAPRADPGDKGPR